MKVVALGRRQGKTEALLRWMQEAPDDERRVIVSHSGQEAMRLLSLARARKLPVESWQFVAASELQGGRPWSGIGGQIVLGFDNIDLSLPMLVHWPVGAISVTPEEPAREDS